MAGSSLPLPLPGGLGRDGAELAQHVDFVRRLARGLVADAAASEDLAQETWLATLERPELPSGSLRAWLASVLRKRAALALRRGERRARRESAHAVDEAGASTAELVERMELHGRIVAAVLALPEAYREVVLRRYFEGESTADIAEALSVPEATVRTRLARAHERLRRRIEVELGGERALAALALARLARGGAPASTATAPLAALSSVAALLAMKKILAVLVVVVLALVAVWSSRRAPSAASRASEVAGEPALGAAPALASAEAVPAASAALEPARAPLEEAQSPPASAPAAEETAAVVAAEPEPETAWLEVHVRDGNGQPVPEAKVRIDCYRTLEDPGSSHSLGDDPVAATDRSGVARLEHPRHIPSATGPERSEIGSVCLTVEHADYVTWNDWGVDVGKGPVEVVLKHGALLIVAGRLADELVTDVEPHLTDEAKVERGDWVALRDGRLSCSRLPPGRHALYLTRAGESGTWASAVVEFEMGEEEVRELTLELQAPRVLTGRLDARVPRPVTNGEVLLNLYIGDFVDRTSPRTMRLFRAEVEADGSFAIPGLPPGTGEMIGMCDGWVSTRSDEPDVKDWARRLQAVDPSAGAFELAMEPSAILELHLLDPDGEPVEDATVYMWPNVHWSIGYSQIFLDREWTATSDAAGWAVIENIPPSTESLIVMHPRWSLPLVATRRATPERQAQAVLMAGETTTLELRLEPRGE